MDPTACYLEMDEAMNAGDHRRARAQAIALKEWLDRGGFYPPNDSRTEVDASLASVLRRTVHLSGRD